MKRKLLLFTAFFSVISLHAANLYWVGGTGTWNDPTHWSASSGGSGGSVIPTMNDDVFFDQNSFSSAKQTVMVTSPAVCHNIDWSGIDDKAIFSSAVSRTLVVHGSYTLSPLLFNGFLGRTIFASSQPGNVITTAGRTIIGDWEFNGSGEWLFGDDVITEKKVTLIHTKGTLNTNNKTIYIGSFDGRSTQNRTLKLGASEIFMKYKWDLSTPTNLNFDPGTSRIIFEDSLNSNRFRSGGLTYSSVSAMAAGCSPSGTPCATFTISITGTNVICNGDNNGTANATVLPAAGPYSYDWSPGTPTGDFTPSITNLGPGTYTLKVINTTTGLFCFCSISITEPGVLFDFELATTSPTCNGLCNGQSSVAATGGTGAYSYLWTPTGNTNDTLFNACANTYTVQVTDQNGCTNSTTINVTQPAPLADPVTSTNVTCFGACNGTATASVSGGTAPYTYDWTPGSPTGDGTPTITNLCPGTYTCTVTDANLCTATSSATITQPPILTLAVSKTNASCGGVCDGTATATITGGTSTYTYSWTSGSVTSSTPSLTNTVSGLCAGSYTVTVTDANGCTKTASVVITEPPVLVATASGTTVTCFGFCNGTATVVVTGGNGGNTYDWTPGTPSGDGTATVTGLCPGTYTVNVVDINGCNDTGVVTITEPPLLLANPVSTNVLCFGACNGTATSTPTGGTPPYSYNWSPGSPTGDGTPTITNLCPGAYSVTVMDSHSCVSTQGVVVTEPPALTANATHTNVTCNGACNGTASAAPTGGTPGYTYAWSTGATTSTISGLCPGSYTVTVSDANLCTNSQTVVITQPSSLTVSVSSTALACNGYCNATATATILGGTPTYTIDWTGTPVGDGTSVISSLCAGVYTVNVVDGNGCPVSASTTILQPTALTLSTAVTNVNCFGLCTGSAAAIAGGGTPGYSYSWSGGQTTSSISSQCAGSYTVTVTDLNGCTLSATVVITQPPQLLGNPSVVSSVLCAGDCNGSATSAATGGVGPYIYDWTPGSPTGDGTPTITNLCAGTYNLVITDANSCVSNTPVTITQPPVLSGPITASTSSCNICNGTATVTPTGGTAGYSILWSDGQTTTTAVGLCPNVTYTVTVTDANNCTASSTVTVMQTIIISITTSSTTLSCAGGCDGIVTANAAGGTIPYSFIWNGPGPAGPIVSLTQTASSLCAGTYYVNVSDAAGCFNMDSVTFTNPTPITVTTSGTNIACGGTCTGTATANPSGGTGVFTYLWMPGGQTTQTATALCAGTYTVTVKDGNNCIVTDSVTVGQPTTVVDNVTVTPANCTFADGVISVAPTGGTPPYSYNWGPGAPTGDGTPTITNLLPGAYTLAITDNAGCVFNFNYLLGNSTGPSLSTSGTRESCHNSCNGTATTVASGGAGGYVYDWTPGAPAGDGTPAITALCGTTTYTITVTDAAGCINLDTFTVINPALISPNPTVVNESCGGSCNGSISLAPTGGTPGYTYAWSTGATSSSISGLCAGVYTFTVTDANGCDSSLTITLTSPPILTATMSSTNVLCNGFCNGTATVTAGGGTGAGTYIYSWSHGGAFILPNVIALCPGGYTVTVSDGNGCTVSGSVTITQPASLTTSTSFTNASCFSVCDGQAIVTALGGTIPYGYSWSPGPVANDTASGLCAGTYTATVTDANGCTSSPPAVVISEPVAISPNATGTNPTCRGACNGTATANPTGGSGVYTYSWNTVPVQTTQTATNLCGGTYIVTVDDGSCSMTQNVTITDPPFLLANPSSTSPTCSGGCDGSVIASPSGGTGIGTYTYSWSPGGAVTQMVSPLCAGIYQVVVTDANGCVDTATVNLVNPPAIDAAIGSTPSTCGACDGTITITPITGLPPYTYSWTNSFTGLPPGPPFTGNGTANVSNVCAGLYDVLVTDANGCDSTFTIPMNSSSGPTSATIVVTNATCPGVCNGMAAVTSVTGGTPGYSFLWSDPATTANDTAFALCDSAYFVQITDAAGCVFFPPPVNVTEPAPILANAIVTSALCSNVCNGAIIVAPTGGTGGYSYFWAPGVITGQGTNSVSGLCPGTYTLTITDGSSCVQVDSFVVTQSTPLTATINSTNISCSNACTGVAYVSITSGTAPFTLQWNDPMGQANDTAFALCAGAYSIDITDANGCTLTLSTTITSAPALVANPTITGATCGLCDGTATLAPTGGTPGFTYVWSNGDTTATADSLCAGLYTVNITDANGCLSSLSIPVSNPTGPGSAVIASTNVTCNGACNGSVTSVTPAGGTAPYTFLWIGSGATTGSLSSLCAGTYYVQITDANGCSLVDSVVITEPAPIMANQVITAATCGLCDGTVTIAPSGGTPPYTILWNTGSSALSLTNLCAGLYSVSITDAAGCSINQSITINSQGGPTLSASATDVLCGIGPCNGIAGVATSGGTPPYSYLWNDISAQTTDTTLATLCAGTYFVTVTDATGCVTLASATIDAPDSIGFSSANAIDPLCNGTTNGSITVIPSGGTLSYIYSWTPAPAAGQTTPTASGLNANTYSVTVTDANGCTASQSVTLVNPASLTISNTFVDPSCNTIADGSIDVTVGGGTLPYAYLWSGGSSAITEDLTSLLAGSYTITVTDSNSCTIADTIILTSAQNVIANAGNDTTFCQSGSLTLSAAASSGGITYTWYEVGNPLSVGSGVTIPVNPPSGTTVYYVVVDNGTGCTDNDTINVTSNPAPTVNAGSDITIVTGQTTTLGGSPTSGTAGVTYSWSPVPGAMDNPASANPVATPTVTTTYTITVTTPGGCTASDTVTVTVRPGISIPNGVSPNNDGSNDEWIIDGIEMFPDCVVEVYNRWGELLFQSIGYKEHWKGTYKDKPLPVGTYYYVIDLKDPLFPDAYTGPITIMR
ncbi:MAG: gliding motility-associated C-terminal domain-containing protein [Bacteroidia bacterium]